MTDWPSFRFESYTETSGLPNVVVDGSPNEATTLCLTHWPGIAQPPGLGADLSAQMAFRYLDRLHTGLPSLHGAAEVVTNNHFDQDGLVSAFALIEPEAALARRDLLIDVARAGDFAVFRDRRAARVSMALASFGEICDLDPSDPNAYDHFAADAYRETLPLLASMVDDPESYRERWADEDEVLSRSEAAIADGRVTVTPVPSEAGGSDGLVSVDIGDSSLTGGHRFGSGSFDWIHPMALNRAAGDHLRLLVRRGRRYRFVDRYESWVQFKSMKPPPRVDLAPLAGELTSAESGPVTWSADPPGALTPELTHDGESTLDLATVIDLVGRHLQAAPPAWFPNRVR